MNTIQHEFPSGHHWFRSANYCLPGHIDVPQEGCGRLGVLIVPPFGWEDVCCYRPLRFLGKTIAESGMPVLRFDLPGTGDSSGNALDPRLFDTWIESITAAADALREATGVEDVAAVGIRLGAMLALAAATRGANLQDLVLWGPAATGRSVLRELRAFASAAPSEYANSGEPAPEPVPGFEAGGFLITPELQQALEALDLTNISGLQGRRVLILSRDDLPADAKLVRALQSAECAVEAANGSGYAAMMAFPHDAVPAVDTSRAIAQFLAKGVPEKAQGQSAAAALPARSSISPAAGVRETIYPIEHSSESMFGILCEPDWASRSMRGANVSRAEFCALLLNAGGTRHIGPNRMWVEAARRWAARGIPSLRLDLLGIGESDGEAVLNNPGLYQDNLVEQVETAIHSLRRRLGIGRFAAIGLCSGAFWAFHAAIRNPDVRAAILLNPRLFFWDPEVDRQRLLRRATKAFSNWSDWRRVARGEVPLEEIKRVPGIVLDRFLGKGTEAPGHLQIPPERMGQAWAAIERNQTRLTLVFTEDEPLLKEMEDEGQLPPEANPRIRCIRIANAGHTFSPLWAQRMAHQILDRELDAAVRENQPALHVAE